MLVYMQHVYLLIALPGIHPLFCVTISASRSLSLCFVREVLLLGKY